MKIELTVFIMSMVLIFTPLLSSEVSALDIQGESSRVVVRTYLKIHDDGLISMNFKVLWGSSEFTGSDIFRPQVHPPSLPWEELEWNKLREYDLPNGTIEYLFNRTLPDGKTLTSSPEYFTKTVLHIDTSFDIRKNETRILVEFMTLEIKIDLMPSKNSYTIAPLRFLSKMNFSGYPPVGEIVIKTGPSINIQPSSFAINHFLYPEGHRFKSEALYFKNDRVTYDTSEDSIKVMKLYPVFSATILYSLWIGAAILSIIMVAVAGRQAKKSVNKGFEMWFGIGAVCFLAFIPFHLFLSYILLIMGFTYSVWKSKKLIPSHQEKEEKPVEKENGKEEKEKREKLDMEKKIKDKKPIQGEERSPLALPLSKTTIPFSDPSFAPSGDHPVRSGSGKTGKSLESLEGLDGLDIPLTPPTPADLKISTISDLSSTSIESKPQTPLKPSKDLTQQQGSNITDQPQETPGAEDSGSSNEKIPNSHTETEKENRKIESGKTESTT